MRVLLVEDNPRLQTLLAETLSAAGFGLDVAASVADLLALVRDTPYDLVVLDLGLPDGDGLEAIRLLRAQGAATPILIITARGSIDERVKGLDAGADDYLTKPFNNAELLARVRALLRRPATVIGTTLNVGNTSLDSATMAVSCNGQSLELRLSERRLLLRLMRRPGHLVPKGDLETSLSDLGRDVSSNAIEALVSRTRRALNDAGSDIVIETVRGVGYCLKERPR
jgi:DNA-binding response OmpR family regulator